MGTPMAHNISRRDRKGDVAEALGRKVGGLPSRCSCTTLLRWVSASPLCCCLNAAMRSSPAGVSAGRLCPMMSCCCLAGCVQRKEDVEVTVKMYLPYK